MDASSAITKLTALLQQNPALQTKLMSLRSIDDAVALVKSEGINIAKQELQEYIAKNFASGDLAKSILGNSDVAGVAGNLLKGFFGK